MCGDYARGCDFGCAQALGHVYYWNVIGKREVEAGTLDKCYFMINLGEEDA